MSNYMFRSAIGAIIFGSLILFTVFRMIGTEENGGQVIKAAQDLTGQKIGGAAGDDNSGAEQIPIQMMSEPAAESWYQEDAEIEDFSPISPVENHVEDNAEGHEVIDADLASPLEPAPVDDNIGGWGDGG